MPKKLTHEEFEKRLFEIYKNEYTVIGQYEGIKIPIEVKHNKCGTVFKPAPYDITAKTRSPTGCPNCNHRSFAYTTKTFSEKVLLCTSNEYTFEDIYTTTHDIKKFYHKKCNKYFMMRPNNFLIKGNRCPNCTISKGEDAVEKWLIQNSFDYQTQYKPGKNLIGSNFKSFDFKVNIDNEFILIEFDGRQHYEPLSNSESSYKKFNQVIQSDIIKNQYAIKNYIPLIRIGYKDLKNVDMILNAVFNDYLLSESTLETYANGNVDIEEYLINLQ